MSADRSEYRELVEIANSILALLYKLNRAITFGELCRHLSVSGATLQDALASLVTKLEGTSLLLNIAENSAKLGIRPDYASCVKGFTETRRAHLSQASLEVLLIIADKSPATKRDIEEYRPIDCESSLHTLLDHGLIKASGELDSPGAPIIYTITDECLHYFGFQSFAQLTDLIAQYKAKYASDDLG